MASYGIKVSLVIISILAVITYCFLSTATIMSEKRNPRTGKCLGRKGLTFRVLPHKELGGVDSCGLFGVLTFNREILPDREKE